MSSTYGYSKGEEIANAIIHGIGALLSVAALVLLTVVSTSQGTVWHAVSFILFGASMLFLFTCSTLAHSVPRGKVKHLFDILDHAAIYLFIAGTYTPFMFIAVKGTLGWTLLGIVWGLAIAGTIFKSIFVKRFVYLSTVLYLLLGWLIMFAWKPLVANVPQQGMSLLVAGGLIYTVGAVFFVWKGFRFHHAIWHLSVLGGSVTHFFAVLTLIS